MLALVDALEEWIHYMLGSDIQIFTDNSTLRYLQNSARLYSRQIRWLENIQVYSTLKTAHISVNTNTAADVLSCSPTLQEEVIEVGRLLPVGFVIHGDLAVAAPSTFNFQPSGLATLVTEPMADWWRHYLNDTKFRNDFFHP